MSSIKLTVKMFHNVFFFLDMSDDDDAPTNVQKDDSWNPKMKMSHCGAKKDRPIRDSVKNIAIEKGLKKASEKRDSFGKIKSHSKMHKINTPNTSNSFNSFRKIDDDFAPERSKSKKAGNTAKQRLGKILGLKF